MLRTNAAGGKPRKREILIGTMYSFSQLKQTSWVDMDLIELENGALSI